MKRNLLILITIVLMLFASACTTYTYQPSTDTPTGDVISPVDITDGEVEELLEDMEDVAEEVEEEAGELEELPEEEVPEEEVEEEAEGTEEEAEEPETTGEETEEVEVADEVSEETPEEEAEESEEESSPEVSLLGKADVVAYEGELVDLNPYAKGIVTDPDGDIVVLKYTKPFDDEGLWQTEIGDAGFYSVIVIATDGKDESFVTKQMTVNILVKNKPPVLNIGDALEFNEGDLIELKPVITDEDGDDVTVTFSGWMVSSSYQTTYEDAGVYEVVVTAEDEYSEVSKKVTITVNDVNRVPVVELKSDDSIIVTDGTLIVTEGDLIQLTIEASDPDGDELTMAYSEPMDETGMWQTEKGDRGEYPVTVTVSDGVNEVTEQVTVKVLKANDPPVIESVSVSPQKVVLKMPGDEQVVQVNVVASDPDGDELTMTYSGYMDAETKTIVYGEKGGVKEVTVTVSDGTDEVSKTVTFSINNWPCFDCSS